MIGPLSPNLSPKDIGSIEMDFTIFYGMYTTEELHIMSGVTRDGLQTNGPGRVDGTAIGNHENATVTVSLEMPPKLFTVFSRRDTLDITEIQFCYPDRTSEEFDQDKSTYPDLYSFFPNGNGGGDLYRIACWPAEKIEPTSMIYKIRMKQLNDIVRASSKPGTIEHNVSGHVFGPERNSCKIPAGANEPDVSPLITQVKKLLGMDLGLPEL
jgi:hypothetical protein